MDDRPRTEQRLAAACAAVAVGLAAGLPPEVFPETGPLVALLLVAGHALVRRALPPAPVGAGLALALFAFASTLAPGLYAPIVSRHVLVAAAFALCWRLGRDALGPVVAVLGAIGAALGLLAIAQRVWLIDLQLAAARRLELPEAFVVRLSQGRPYGTHVVPAALGGLLVLVLLALVALVADRAEGRRTRRGLVLAAAVPVGAGLVATASAGAIAGLAAGLAVPLVAIWKRGRRGVVVAAVLAALLAGLGAVALRRDALDGVVRSLEERAGNWRGAVAMIVREPVTGVGPGAYRSVWPQLRRADEVETAYAHDSWLQLVAEGGLPWLVLVLVGAWSLARRTRAAVSGDAPWLVGAVVAFAVQNLADFTLYLPGVALPAAALAGFVFSRPDADPRDPAAPAMSRFAVAAVCAAVLAAGLVFAGDALARRALDAGEGALAAGRPEAAAHHAARAARWGTIDVRRLIGAARLAVRAAPPGRPAPRGPAAGWLERARRLDPESPAPWSATVDLELRAGRPTAAWRASSLAVARHPADAALRARHEELEQALRRAGMLSEPLAYGGAAARPFDAPWTTWDDLLLVAGAALALVVLIRVGSVGPAPPAAVALGLLLLFALWGEGGALPGARLGRQTLLAAGCVATLAVGARGLRVRLAGAGRIAAALLAAAGAWAVVAAIAAPYPAAARDGLGSLAGAFAAGGLSFLVASHHPAWRRLLVALPAAGASAMGVLWLAQRALLAGGVDLSAWPAPLHVAAGRDPAADFLHPGHLGTLLLATGAAVGVTALARGTRDLRRLAWSATLVLVGLSGLARASLLALAGAALAAASLPLPRRTRRVLVVGLVLAAVVGTTFVGWRLAVRDDPYAWSRARIWTACVAALAERPLVGWGPGGFAARAAAFAVEDPTAVARWGKVFSGPHSDPLGALLALGLPGGLALLAGLAGAGREVWRRARAQLAREPERAGLVVLLAALACHALVDDLLAGRPALALLFAAALGGALAGGTDRTPAARDAAPVRRSARIAAMLVVVVALAALEGRPWLADRVRRAGDPLRAAALDPARASTWIAAARLADGPPAPRLGRALDRVTRAILAFPEGAAGWRERGRLLEAACRGPLPDREVCAAARDAFTRAVALEPHDVVSMRRAGRLSVLLGEPDAAAGWFDRALGHEPDYLGARLDRLRLAVDRGALDEARAMLRDLLDRRERLAHVVPQTPRDAVLATLESWELRDLDRLRARVEGGTGSGP
ncbi:MAG: hypothetical protein D6738_13090 [Acidobacteria bacterium]|nr:MAG: hypothetical protein D6738_13090 [Acidobacteriota bacterium]